MTPGPRTATTAANGVSAPASFIMNQMRGFVSRLRDRAFWQVQVAVAAITMLHYFLVGAYDKPGEPLDHLHFVAPALYTFPIIWSSLHFGREGGVFTALWCGVLLLPCFWDHQDSLEWVIPLTQILAGLVVGVALSSRVEYEAAQKQQAQEMSARLVRLHQQVTQAHEDERRYIARELHDTTAQSLILVGRGLDSVASIPGVPEPATHSLHELRAMADDLLSDVRRLSRDLRPSVLDDLGLVAAVEWFTVEFGTRNAVLTRVEVLGAPHRLPPDVELALFRIAQEALRNVEKHAAASSVTVVMGFYQNAFELVVEDNGRGFEIPPSLCDFVGRGNLGLVGMEERALLLGGTLDLQSSPGKGTRVSVAIDHF